MQQTNQHFHYIIIGAGCSGLSLAVRMAADKAFADKRILIIDKAPKSLNDRTWCFWERNSGYFENLVHHSWTNLSIKHPEGEMALHLKDYAYKLIRGIDFYKHCFNRISQAPNIQVHYGAVTKVDAATGTVTTKDTEFTADQVFSSVLLEEPSLQEGEYYLLQHFRGWWIETNEDFFDPQQAELMNFRTSQQHGCAFVYMLPVSKRRALVEYTLFTEETLPESGYDEALKAYIQDELKLKHYSIAEVENGVIPMTNLQFLRQHGKIMFIGTAGGQTKASTGYTFQFIQKQCAAIVGSITKTGNTTPMKVPKRFRFYDSVLLRVLHERKINGADVFYHLFRKNSAARVLRFLDNESTYLDEFIIMNTTPKLIFIPAAMAEKRHAF